MTSQDTLNSGQIKWRAFFLFFALLVVVYSNTFQSPWHLDDLSSISDCPQTKITDLTPHTLWQSIHAKGRINRPLARLSLALNWYYGKGDVRGFHIFNLLIHILTAFFLFITILALFETPNLSEKYKGNRYFLALLSAVLWAVNPMQTQAVTYIVQRMTSLAALFYLASLYFFIKARLTKKTACRIWLYMGCVAGFLLAIASKENAAMLSVSLVLVEALFFRDLADPRVRQKFLITGGMAIIAVFVLGCFFKQGHFFSFLDGYKNRPFSLSERLLTEPRIVVFYLSQLFYPVPTRLSIEHYFPLSSSLFDPLTTLMSVGFILILISIAFFSVKKRPLLCFAILFFFLNHIIESSFVPLELVFEHRNYLPSFFLFVPLAAGLKWLIDYYSNQGWIMASLLVGFVILVITGLGIGTYVRNMAWQTGKVFWEDAIKKAPEMQRPYHNLAYFYYGKIGAYDQAINLYEQTRGKGIHSLSEIPLPEFNIANIWNNMGQWHKAVEHYKKTLAIDNKFDKARYRLASIYARNLNNLLMALHYLNPLLAKYPDLAKAFNLKGLILLKQNKPEQARIFFKRCLAIDAHFQKGVLNMAIAFYLLGDYNKTELYLKYLRPHYKEDIRTVLWLILVNMKTKDTYDVEKYGNLIMNKAKFKTLDSGLKKLFKNGLMLKEDYNELNVWFFRYLKEKWNYAKADQNK